MPVIEVNGLAVCRRLAEYNELSAVKRLDDLIFGAHHGITMTELEFLYEHGHVIVLENERRELVGLSQVLLQPLASLSYNLPEHEAYYYGTGVHPDYQACGLGQCLAEEQDRLACAAGKIRAVLTCRVENYPSLKLRFGQEFVAIRYIPDFYGPLEEDGARLLLVKDFLCEDGRCTRPSSDQECRYMPVTWGDAIDFDAHRRVRHCFDMGFRAVSVSRTSGILFIR